MQIITSFAKYGSFYLSMRHCHWFFLSYFGFEKLPLFSWNCFTLICHLSKGIVRERDILGSFPQFSFIMDDFLATGLMYSGVSFFAWVKAVLNARIAFGSLRSSILISILQPKNSQSFLWCNCLWTFMRRQNLLHNLCRLTRPFR